MANTNSEQFEKLRDYVMYFTMTAAVLAGIVWLISLVPGNDFQSKDMLLGILSGATSTGGTVMGLLYLIHRLREK